MGEEKKSLKFCGRKIVRSVKGAFTLIEVLIVIALVGALAALTVVNVNIFPDQYTSTPKGYLIMAIKEAKIQALERGVEVSLFFDKETYDLIIFRTFDGEETWRMNMLGKKYKPESELTEAEKIARETEKLARPEISLEFFPLYPESTNLSAIGASSFADRRLSCLRFFADSTMTPARILLKFKGETVVDYNVDIFTGFKRLERKKK